MATVTGMTVAKILELIGEGVGGLVSSVNGMQGEVVLNAASVGAVETVNGKSGPFVNINSNDIGALPLGTVGDLFDSSMVVFRMNIHDDGTPTSGWPDRLAFYNEDPSMQSGWNRAGYFNEYGELRARPGNTNTVGFRAMSHWAADPDQEFFQVSTDQGMGNQRLGIDKEFINLYVPMRHGPNQQVIAKTFIIDEGEPVPTGTPDNSVIVVRPL